MPVIPEFKRLTWEDHEFQTSLDYVVIHCEKGKEKQNKKKEEKKEGRKGNS
jgi:hypothetical protein